MLEFVLGTSGSGKTVAIYEQIADRAAAGKNILLLVPEQYSFESERTLFERIGPVLMRQVEVLSFKRLANAVFRAYGGLSAEVIDDTGKLLTMSAALYQLSDQLDYYAKKAANTQSVAFISDLVEVANELKNACVTAEKLRGAAEKIGIEKEKTLLCGKVKELALIMETYQALIDAAGSDPTDDLVRACCFLEEHNFFAEKQVYIDSFNDFTADEFLMLEYIIRGAENVTVALACDSFYDELEGCGLFSIVQKTAQRLMRIARKESVQTAAPLFCTSGKRFTVPAVAHLEKYLLRAEQKEYSELPEEIKLTAAGNCYEEAEYVAAEIRKLVAEKGCRYRDIAVIARSTQPYQDAIGAAFEKYEIPLFMDKRVSVMTKPLMALIICAVKIATEGFSTELLLRLAKTGLAGVSVEEIGELEEYIYIWNINGGRWRMDFTEDPDGFEGRSRENSEKLEAINASRRKLIGPLEKLRSEMAECDGVGFATAVYSYLRRLNVTEQLEQLAQKYEMIGETVFADELEPLWELTISLLEQFAVTLKGVCLPEKRFAELFRLAAAKADIGMIPHTVDQVTVGSADRIRTGDIKAVFVIGVNDGEFPAIHEGGGIFTASDRQALALCGLDISEKQEDRPLFERMFLYHAMTCASEMVSVSYKKYDLDGKPLQPSAVIKQLETLFPLLKAENVKERTGTEDIWNDTTAFEIYAANRREAGKSEFIASLREYLLAEPKFSGRTEHLGDMFTPERFRIADREITQRLIGKKLRLAPSNIDRYFSCRFWYFCYDCLRLKKRRKAEMSPLETGTLIHHVLENMLREYQPSALVKLEKQELEQQVERLLNNYLKETLGGSTEKTPRFIYLYERLKNSILRLLQRLGDEFEQCDFVPAAFELAIKENSNPVSSVKLCTENGTEIVVEGTVDRVDVMERDGKKYVRVVDYKSGGKEFNLSDVYYGINLQMLIYLFSIQRQGSGALENAIPAGVLYLPADGEVVEVGRGATEEEIRDKGREHYRMNGLLLNDLTSIKGMDNNCTGKFIPINFNKDGSISRAEGSKTLASLEEMGSICRYIDGLITDMARMLEEGDVAAVPLRSGKQQLACDYCEYAEICRRSADSPEKNMLTVMSRADFYEAINLGNEISREGGGNIGKTVDKTSE